MMNDSLKYPYFNTLKYGIEKKIISEYPEYYQELFNFVIEENISISERIWLYQNGLKECPKCANSDCNKKVSFIKFYIGYRKYCSRKCSIKDTYKNLNTKEKRINAIRLCNMNPEKRSIMTINANKTKSKFSVIKKSEINEKRKKTCLYKYGVENISSLDIIKKSVSKKLKNKISIIKLNKTINNIKSLGFYIDNIENDKFSLICPTCNKNFTIHRTLFNSRNRFNTTICLNCNPNNNYSDFEFKIYCYINSIYTGTIYRQYKKFKKYEIDIFLPDINIGIECNGLWWHSEYYKDKNYHSDKTNFFIDKNIQIIHIWEDDWKLKSDIVKSRIKNLLNLSSNRIYARDCNILKVRKSDAYDFLHKNHIQGPCISKTYIGLYNKNELVTIISFGEYRKSLGRKSVKNEYELIRFCSKLDTVVIGGFSKLLKNFLVNYNPDKIITYASKDWSSGNLYISNGFTKIRENAPNYFYFNKDQGIRINRFSFRKDKLLNEGHSKNLTEHNIMNNIGYYRIYNSGTILYEMKNYDFNKGNNY